MFIDIPMVSVVKHELIQRLKYMLVLNEIKQNLLFILICCFLESSLNTEDRSCRRTGLHQILFDSILRSIPFHLSDWGEFSSLCTCGSLVFYHS